MTVDVNPRLLVMRAGLVLAEHPLPPGAELVLGRSEGCQVTIPDSSVSRLHARIFADEHGVYLEDLGSANGTFVDGQRVRGRVRLADGQQLRAAQKALSNPVVLRFDDPLAFAASRHDVSTVIADPGDGDLPAPAGDAGGPPGIPPRAPAARRAPPLPTASVVAPLEPLGGRTRRGPAPSIRTALVVAGGIVAVVGVLIVAALVIWLAAR